MYQRILVPLDGSSIAEQALPLAKMLAVRFQSSVVLFQDIQVKSHTDKSIDQLQKQALGYLETIRQRFPTDISIERETRVGLPAAAILEFAESAHIDLIAMATHGRTGLQRWHYGSVADKVLDGARLPILLVRASETPSATAPIKQILVPLDGSELAKRALMPAQHLAQAFDAELLLVRVQEPSYAQGGLEMSMAAFDEALGRMVQGYLAEQTQQLKSHGVRARWETHFGMAAEGILDVAQKCAVNLIVMSTHGRSGIGRWIMGSVADRVLRASRIPVLLIRSSVGAE